MPGDVTCLLCPRRCRIPPGAAGDCRVRVNLDGRLLAVTYGRPVAVHVDPMEKKPLFHFLPGAEIFSLATVGCNLHCIHCQNWEISQADPGEHDVYDLPPDRVAAVAAHEGCRAVAWTYTEPIVFYEYTYDGSVACRERGLKTVLVSAGYANPRPWRRLCGVIDAAILDLKAFSDAHYREVCGGTLAPVLEAIRIAHEEGVWIEVLNLLVPTRNDDPALVDALVDWMLTTLGPDVPLHFTAFHPDYRLKNLPPTPTRTLLAARKRALGAGLHHVYVGNVPGGEAECTWCPACHARLVHRVGYRVLENRLAATGGRCPECGAQVAGVWA
ncbi:MAG: AmmeMemoRadiSam system radical SAM enzyme [Deltaproteobacteria bacterium]|nr:AmmeMemoRadiSam system radical SAM enzyme [Deltaproteobacteria bacterium]